VIEIRPLLPDDWPSVKAIFVEGIATRAATFETEPPSWREFDASHHSAHRLVGVEDDQLVGWATLAPTSARACYAGVAESSVYVAENARGSGVGRALMKALIAGAREDGMWSIRAGMFPENTASVALHERLGFRLVGHFERVAQLDGVWRDTILLELRL
jgi:L-amino acid N-acyltransferase YncA